MVDVLNTSWGVRATVQATATHNGIEHQTKLRIRCTQGKRLLLCKKEKSPELIQNKIMQFYDH